MSKVKNYEVADRVTATTERQLGIRWPVEVDHLLDAFVQRANDAGAKCTRKEMVAALVVADRQLSGEQLFDALVAYRQTKVQDILTAPTDTASSRTRGRSRG